MWQDGFQDWIKVEDCESFQNHARKKTAVIPPKIRKRSQAKLDVSELHRVCRGLIADGKISSLEISFLAKWLENAGTVDSWPATEIADTVERIVSDGQVTEQEKTELLNLLNKVCIW